MYYTTLNAIRAQSPCKDGWKNLLAYLGKSKADDEPLSLATILEANGIEHAIWALRAVEGINDLTLLFAVRCVREHCQHMLTDRRWLDALDLEELSAVGVATEEDLWSAFKYLEECRHLAVNSEEYTPLDASISARWAIMTLVVRRDVLDVAIDSVRCASRVGVALSICGSICCEEKEWDDSWNTTWDYYWDTSWKIVEADFKSIFCES